MSRAVLSVRFAGPHVSVQDGGRVGMMRFGVPRSGPMDRLAFTAANRAVGNPESAAGIEVSLGGLVLDCLSGQVGFAVAGGSFIVDHDEDRRLSWSKAVLKAGQSLTIRPGFWGSWCYLALAGDLQVPQWLGSAATHALSGFGGGRLVAGSKLEVDGCSATGLCEGGFIRPVMARPKAVVRVTMGPQQRFFSAQSCRALLEEPWRMTDACDRMGVRLSGPVIAPDAALSIPSEPVSRGSIQVAGDGVATVLLADHQTTGGYPKIATVLDCDMDGFVQLRPRDQVRFLAATPAQAVGIARTKAMQKSRYLAGLSRY